MKIYARHLFFELAKFTFFSFFAICITLDLVLFSTYSQSSISLSKWIDYLFCQKVLFLYFILPLSLLIGSVFVCFQKRKNLEFLAIFSSGISKVKLFTPFLLFSFLISLILFASDAFLFPRANEVVFEMKNKLAKRKKHVDKLTVLNLTEYQLILNNYSPEDFDLEDLYVVENPQKIWHFENYNLEKQIAYRVDLFEKKDTFFSKTASLDSKSFAINPNELLLSQIPFDKISLSSLYSLSKKPLFTSKKKKQIFSQIHQKINFFILPLVISCFIASFFIKSFSNRLFLQILTLFPISFGLYFFISLFATLYELGITSTTSIYLASLFSLAFLLVKSRLYPY